MILFKIKIRAIVIVIICSGTLASFRTFSDLSTYEYTRIVKYNLYGKNINLLYHNNF